MGSACCVAARDKTLPERTDSEVLQSNARYSPSWSSHWENQGHVIGEMDNQINQFSHGSSGNVGVERKDQRDMEMGDVSDGGSPREDFQTPTWEKFPVNEGTAVNLRNPASDSAMGNAVSTMVKDLGESSVVVNPSVSKALTSSSSISKPDPLSSPSQTPPIYSGPSTQANCSPGHQLVRQISVSRIPGLKSPNSSVSEGRQSFAFSMCSNDTTMGSQGGPSDGWSMRAFSELVASSQRERWSFDSESLDSSRGKLTRSSSRLSVPPSVDMQTCGACLKLLTERSSWSSQKIIATSELSVVAVLVCGHVFHAECLEHITPEKDRYDPACPLCVGGEKQVPKMSWKASRIEADLKAKSNWISRNRVVDSDLEEDTFAPDDRNGKGTGRQGKVLKLGPSSSMGSFGKKPFLRRHFSLGSNRSKSLSENDSSRRKGFWARYRKD
ncbi:uncharacterized protein LOC122091924 [Macadamia integrifolia]|uniref:uncharacterized protein LOC122091924 n=1 Tax=Macadamia integrifolia TaxID=60698 RepID=UPI001C4E580E|nr:uncharacterized protein LOC122091924 [Macadamia integrifolia]XP_042518106.1 uncharacterized protein LOC122091924 [Macadamia integrifolia]